mmetsp:Transcript_20469/g.56812  ORF Transcript_20469/g.56812 Transcript_20469/m.56812 type:complete len:624 (+) Transcript_20469:205-2076(+)
MPLGLAKDSMLNLAELASKTEEDSTVEQDGSTHEPVEDYDGLLFRKVVDPDGEDDDGGLLIDGSDDVIDIEADISNPTTAFGNTLNSSNDPDMSSAASNKTDVDPKSYQYAGFQADYHDFENYTSYDYYQGDYISSGSGLQFGSDKKGQSTCWKCIFPWNYTEDEEDDEIDEYSVTDGLPVTEDQAMGTVSNNNDDGDNDEVSMISAGSGNALGGKPFEKDRQTVLAGLGSTQSDDGGSESGVKGILKHASKGRDYKNHSTRSHNSSQSQQGKQRRSLFPAYEPQAEKRKDLQTSFSPMARVVTIKSSKEMDDTEKGHIWWQKPDYDEFRRTGRMISKVMLQGGSEIWLATNQSWQLPNQGKAATLRRAMENADKESTSDKWWHKFGHSRRGLEHIASIDEGRQRQANVKTSIRAVLTEQRRQKAFHREDPEKLRMCSIQNTSWAKDLALASGASDADAVSKNFDDVSRKSREFYLLKLSRAGELNSTTGPQRGTKQVVPAFMKPMMSMTLKSNRLDANTTSRIQFRKKEGASRNANASSQKQRVTSDVAPAIATRNDGKTPGSVSSEPIHDPKTHGLGEMSLASKAAGFANGEEAVNMSAVLTGMGAIPKNTDAARARPVLA